MAPKEIIQINQIETKILFLRGEKIILSFHLAELYGVETRVLNQAVKRNKGRFPVDFVFQINRSEAEWLVSQNVIPHIKYFGGSMPYAFTEQGVAMASSVLKSNRAILANVAIMRAFVKIRRILAKHEILSEKLQELENKYEKHDSEISSIFSILRQLISEEEKPKTKIGFLT
jgi:hypothetical protein